MEALNGKWKLAKVEDFAPFLDAIGVGADNREKALIMLAPDKNITQDITINGNDVSITTTTPVSTVELKAKIGEVKEHTGWDGNTMTSTFSQDGDKLVEDQSGPYTCKNVRQASGDTLTMTMTSAGVTSTRTYNKI